MQLGHHGFTTRRFLAAEIESASSWWKTMINDKVETIRCCVVSSWAITKDPCRNYPHARGCETGNTNSATFVGVWQSNQICGSWRDLLCRCESRSKCCTGDRDACCSESREAVSREVWIHPRVSFIVQTVGTRHAQREGSSLPKSHLRAHGGRR